MAALAAPSRFLATDSATSRASAASSSPSSARTPPHSSADGASPRRAHSSPSLTSPTAILCREVTSVPTAAHILRICRLRPSLSTNRSLGFPFESGVIRVTSHGIVGATVSIPSLCCVVAMTTPSRSVRREASETARSVSTSYVFGALFFGSSSASGTRPSSVRSTSPLESRSSLPTGNTRRGAPRDARSPTLESDRRRVSVNHLSSSFSA